MSVLALDIERPAILGGELRAHPEGTLDEVVGRVWTALHAGRIAACPVCDGSLLPGRPARCRACGSSLS